MHVDDGRKRELIIAPEHPEGDNFEKDFQYEPRFACVTAVCLSANDVRQVKRMVDKAPGLRAFRSRIRVEPVSAWS